jgi:hypothetical protein
MSRFGEDCDRAGNYRTTQNVGNRIGRSFGVPSCSARNGRMICLGPSGFGAAGKEAQFSRSTIIKLFCVVSYRRCSTPRQAAPFFFVRRIPVTRMTFGADQTPPGPLLFGRPADPCRCFRREAALQGRHEIDNRRRRADCSRLDREALYLGLDQFRQHLPVNGRRVVGSTRSAAG